MSNIRQTSNAEREVEFLKRAPPKHIRVRQNTSQRKKKSSQKDFPIGKEVFNDSTSLVDEKFKLLVDIAKLQEEIQPMKEDIEYLRYLIYKTQEDSEGLKQVEELEEKSQEYSDACIEYENYCDMYSDIILERLNKEFKQMKQSKKITEMDIGDLQKLLDYTNYQLQDEQLQKYKEKYDANESKIQDLKATLRDLKRNEKEQTASLCQIYANQPPDEKSIELNRLTSQYNALKVTSLNKRHEVELQKRYNEDHYKKKKNEKEAKKAQMEEKQKRKEFNEKWKKKREEEEANDKNRDTFLFDSYMKMVDFQSRPNDVNQPSTQSGQVNPRTKRIGYNAKKPKQPRKTAPSQNRTQVLDANENMSTDDFESFEGSPVKGNEENEDNSLLTTKTFGMDDFTSTTDLDKSMKSTKNGNDTVDFTKTLQS